MALNVLAPLIYATLTLTNNLKWCNRGIETGLPGSIGGRSYIASRYSIGFLQLVSGIVLIIAIIIIRRFLLKDRRLERVINYQSMTIHGLSFTLFIISVVIFYYFYFLYNETDDKHRKQTTRNTLIAWIVTVYTNFIAQLFLIMIFLKFRKNKGTAQ